MVCHKSQAVDAREWSVYAQRGRFFLMLDSKHQTQSKYLMKGHTAQCDSTLPRGTNYR